MSSNDLKLVPTEQLIDEVISRFNHTVIIVKKFQVNPTDPTKSAEMTFRRWAGHPDMCIGMAFDMQDHINHFKKQNVKPVDLKDS